MNLYPNPPEGQDRDYREDELFLTIENLRCQLLEVAQERSLSDHMVLELSQRLDGYIVLAQNLMMESLRSRKSSAIPYGKNTKNQRIRKTALQQ
ncbi:aspartyl-phosphate phosphatase Spo0E family protein [Paenibacillus sp. MMS20-IR301]|uniref:aspartyl-phosphate phosphatase Spo0E family protein n=1 Tax=Paenibacillus sp. MMS20-IR301 TaxID=2895946 RepID=UPI0028E44416|nr:aspartyl-phosphate phosphatase Spo0E family protein [Paenibacillus sp. MMS20-IR301]WNS42557.1 aspartyl-phosphate phosphatase Spo0E family protein [Paenibacillus sp. MMS20-IR301]